MARTDMVVLEGDQQRLTQVLDALRDESNARLAFLLDKNGQHIACSGSLDGVDPTALASLTAGNVAATEGLAALVGEDEFPSLFHEGREENLFISVVSRRVILLLAFDEHSSLGLVRLRVNQRAPELKTVVDEMLERVASGASAASAPAAVLGEITDEDIEALFG
jgi:predicted regulator of Ras-like GTPase activity (Roadblock/LC7/MglB family)